MKYRVTFEELVKVWATGDMIVEAESKEEILESIKNGEFLNKFLLNADFENYEYLWETCDSVAYDLDNAEIEEY